MPEIDPKPDPKSDAQLYPGFFSPSCSKFIAMFLGAQLRGISEDSSPRRRRSVTCRIPGAAARYVRLQADRSLVRPLPLGA